MNKKSISILALSKKIALVSTLTGSLIIQSCSTDGSPRIKDSKEETVYESTKGIVTEVEEIEPGEDYKILDERIIDDKEKSIAIIHTLDGKIDTLSLRKLKDDTGTNYRHSGLRGVLVYSLAASYFNRNLRNVNPSSSSYKNMSTYDKSRNLKNNLRNSATTRRVRVPGTSSSGYGGGKSFRSFGG